MVQALLADLTVRLNKAAIPFMVIGGQAVLIYGEPRLTQDIDITLGVGPEDAARVLDVIREAGWTILSADP